MSHLARASEEPERAAYEWGFRQLFWMAFISRILVFILCCECDRSGFESNFLMMASCCFGRERNSTLRPISRWASSMSDGPARWRGES